MTSRTIPLACVAALAVADLANAQYQASNRTARRLGLQVSEVDPTLPGTITIDSLIGGGVVAFFLELPSPVDVAYSYLTPPLEPFCVDLTSPANATVNLPLPASGTMVFPFGAIGVGAGQPFEFQVAQFASATELAISNGERRIGGPSARETSTSYVENALSEFSGFDPNQYADVEQADVDGDGDPDTVLVACGGTINVQLMSNDDLTDPSIFVGSVPAATSAELADFNDDDWPDLVVSADSFFAAATVFYNLGREAPLPGSNVMGAWRGFSGPTDPFIDFEYQSLSSSRNALDVETADVDGDGRIDFVLACAEITGTVGSQNRLFLNVESGGSITWTEASVDDGSGGPFLAEIEFFDDTEDAEFADLDLDGDYDLVFGNVEGPAAILGWDYVYVNQGGAQGGVAGQFLEMTILPPPFTNADPTVDVMVADLNGDGVPDIYAGNWGFEDIFGGLTPAPDAMYFNTGTLPLTYSDVSTLLPDNPGYTGPVGSRIPAWPTSDVEPLDVDTSTAGDEILVSSGPKCGFVWVGPPGLRLLSGPGAGPRDNALASLIPAAVQSVPINDIETGDWQSKHPDLDIGLATDQVGISSGLLYLTK